MRINRQLFLQQLESVMPGLSSREVVEQSSYFVFRGGWVVTFNDEVTCRMKCPVDFEGAVAGEELVALLKRSPEEEVEVTKGDGELLVKGKGRRTGIRMAPSITLPVDGVDKPAGWHPLSPDFGEAVAMVGECASNDDEKFQLVCIHVHPNYLEACDNLQASRYPIETPLSRDCMVRQSSLKHVATYGMTHIAEAGAWLHFRNQAGLYFACRRYADEYVDLGPLLEVTGERVMLPVGLTDTAATLEIFSKSAEKNYIQVRITHGMLAVKAAGARGWHEERKNIDYQGIDLNFQISPKLLGEITKRHTECVVGDGRLLVDGAKWKYVTCLYAPADENAPAPAPVEAAAHAPEPKKRKAKAKGAGPDPAPIGDIPF